MLVRAKKGWMFGNVITLNATALSWQHLLRPPSASSSPVHLLKCLYQLVFCVFSLSFPVIHYLSPSSAGQLIILPTSQISQQYQQTLHQ